MIVLAETHEVASIITPVVGALGVKLAAILSHKRDADLVDLDEVGKIGVDCEN